jgi:hypothetical protein
MGVAGRQFYGFGGAASCATMTYEKDMDYQTDAELVIIHTDKKLEIVVMK